MLERNKRPQANTVCIGGVTIEGVEVDPQTRCEHYHGDSDIIAILFKCCDRWFPCYFCHQELTNHTVEVWQASEFESSAIICGACTVQLSIADYLACSDSCPNCGAAFNPGCRHHRHLYFAT